MRCRFAADRERNPDGVTQTHRHRPERLVIAHLERVSGRAPEPALARKLARRPTTIEPGTDHGEHECLVRLDRLVLGTKHVIRHCLGVKHIVGNRVWKSLWIRLHAEPP